MKCTKLRRARRERLRAAVRSISSDGSMEASSWNGTVRCTWTLLCWLFWLLYVVGALLLISMGGYLISQSWATGATWEIAHVTIILCLMYVTMAVFMMRMCMVRLLNNDVVQSVCGLWYNQCLSSSP